MFEAIDFASTTPGRDGLRRAASGQPSRGKPFHLRKPRVTAVISPWNFPLAILTGMTTARWLPATASDETGRAIEHHRRQADGSV
jgi:delta 1-pyrroline-5-carboxylate dehydrogenase